MINLDDNPSKVSTEHGYYIIIKAGKNPGDITLNDLLEKKSPYELVYVGYSGTEKSKKGQEGFRGRMIKHKKDFKSPTANHSLKIRDFAESNDFRLDNLYLKYFVSSYGKEKKDDILSKHLKVFKELPKANSHKPKHNKK